jgi:putative sulfotransferase
MERALIISNGRCGSTLLSDLIAEQEETLSAQEFFIQVQPDVIFDEVVSGCDYWALLRSPNPYLSALFRMDYQPPEVRYPDDGRWAGHLYDLPRILAYTLPAVSSDPDGMFDTLARQVPGFPRQSVADHHLMFLDLLASNAGRRRWVERSGASSILAEHLLRSYPMAKVIYLTRERAANALSMSRHPVFQLLNLQSELSASGYDLYNGLDEGKRPVLPALERYLPDRLTKETLIEHSRDDQRFQFLCAFMTSLAEQTIADTAPQSLLRVRYEDLTADPIGELSRIGRFLGFEDSRQWAARCAPQVRAPRAPDEQSVSATA